MPGFAALFKPGFCTAVFACGDAAWLGAADRPLGAEDPVAGETGQGYAHQDHLAAAAHSNDDVLTNLTDGVGRSGIKLHPIALGAHEIQHPVDAGFPEGVENIRTRAAADRIVAEISRKPIRAVAAD